MGFLPFVNQGGQRLGFKGPLVGGSFRNLRRSPFEVRQNKLELATRLTDPIQLAPDRLLLVTPEMLQVVRRGNQVKVVVDLTGNALYFSRAPIAFCKMDESLSLRHQGIYGFRRDALLQLVKWKPSPLERAESLEQLRALENGVKVHVLITAKGSPGIDTLADAEALERKLALAEREIAR